MHMSPNELIPGISVPHRRKGLSPEEARRVREIALELPKTGPLLRVKRRRSRKE